MLLLHAAYVFWNVPGELRTGHSFLAWALSGLPWNHCFQTVPCSPVLSALLTQSWGRALTEDLDSAHSLPMATTLCPDTCGGPHMARSGTGHPDGRCYVKEGIVCMLHMACWSCEDAHHITFPQ